MLISLLCGIQCLTDWEGSHSKDDNGAILEFRASYDLSWRVLVWEICVLAMASPALSHEFLSLHDHYTMMLHLKMNALNYNQTFQRQTWQVYQVYINEMFGCTTA